jgi:hypothetical protein
MSLETDARDAIRAAIAERNDVDVPPERFDDLKPSSPEIGVKNGQAWLTTLEDAAERLVDQGYEVGQLKLEKAIALLNQELIHSSIYLEELSSPQARGMFAKIAATAAVAAVAGAVAYMLRERWKGDR